MLSVILPCYNEKDNLVALFSKLDKLKDRIDKIEIILVNNGSTDNSEEIFDTELLKRDGNIFKVLKVQKNLGYGNGILSGLRYAKGDILAITHADIQTDPLDVIKALEIYQTANNDNLLVKGYRKNRKLAEAVFSYGMGLLASLVFGHRLSEVNAQPKLFSRNFFDKIQQNAPLDFSLDLYFLVNARISGKIIDFPVFFAKRTKGEAKGGSGSTWKVRWKLIQRSLRYIFELRGKINISQK